MKNNGIVSKKSNRRDALSFLLFVFLLPYVCACLWGHVGEETAKLREEDAKRQNARMVEAALSWGVWELPMEEYLTYLLLLVMPESNEPETLKAQAVLLRTELAARCNEQEGKIYLEAEELEQFYGGYEDEEELAAYRRAVTATAGTILTFHGRPIRASSLRLTEEGERSFCYVAEEGRDFVMNQKAADALAQEGRTWKEILSHFFLETELAKFE